MQRFRTFHFFPFVLFGAALQRLAKPLAVVGVVLAAVGLNVSAATLDPAVQRKVQAATFEVVIPKPVDDPLTYEKPLPLELLPYQFRTDKYFSIGTAFAIGGGRYATAGHVFSVALGGLWGAPALRDTAGHVYPVAQIEKFSAHEDFVVFTLATQPADAASLDINPHPVLNEPVYSVGNALGDGVVIRDGLYTSDTPENQDGRWKWLRFSAAASPGNSGGPLLDKDGKVIGIVLMKSANENLNYAVSIDQVLKAPDHLARIDTRGAFRLDIFDKVKTVPLKQEFALPKSFSDFASAYLQLQNEFDSRGLRDLLAENAADIFPRGTGSSTLLHTLYEKTMPALMVRGDNDIWNFDAPRHTHVDLGNGGGIDSARVKTQMFLHLRKPDNIDAAKLVADPALYSQLILKGAPLYRQVGAEKIKITALGKPSEDSSYTDGWGRKWQLRVWPMAFENSVVVSLDLPVPDGYVSLRRVAFALSEPQQVREMEALTDFVVMAFGGTLAQWRDFLTLKNVLPAALTPSMMQFDYGKSFQYQSRRLSFAYTPELQKIEKDNQLTLDFGFVAAGDKMLWDVVGVTVHEDAEGKTEIGAFRHSPPSEDMDESARKSWEKRLLHQHPFDAVAFEDESRQYIRTVYGPIDPKPAPSVLYTFLYRAESGTAQDAMKTKLDLLMKDAHVNEH